jgi:hypothetical protein
VSLGGMKMKVDESVRKRKKKNYMVYLPLAGEYKYMQLIKIK